VFIDNVLQETYDLNNQTDGTADGSFDGRLTPIVRYYTGLTYGSHVIKVVNKNNLYLLFDGFGTLVDRNNADTYLGYHVPKMTAAGYATAPANSSNAITDAMNAKLDSLFATFPSWYPAYLVPVNSYYFPNSGDVTAGVDDVHPNDQGHRHIFDATVATLGNGASAMETGSLIFARSNLYLKNDTGALVKLITGDVIYNQGQTVFGDSMRVGAFNDKPVAIISNGHTIASFHEGANYVEVFGNIRTTSNFQADNGGLVIGGAIVPTSGIGIQIGAWNTLKAMILSNSGAGTNSKHWIDFLSGSGRYFSLVNDAGNADARWLEVTRTGLAVDTVRFPDGRFHISKLATGLTAPTTTGTTKMVVTDANGGLSFAESPQTLDAKFTTQGNTSTGETDLYTYTVPANKLSADGRTVNFEIDGEFNDITATATLKLYFAGNVTLNTGAVAISATGAWKLTGYVIRTSSTTAHVTYQLQSPGLATPQFLGYSNLTSLDFTTTNIFKITGQAGGAGGGTSDITAHSWQVLYKPAQ
jgi:hypothetical protein